MSFDRANLVLMVVAIVHQMATVACWMNAPYGNEKFNYREHYGNNLTIECTDGRLPTNYTFSYWIRPDLVVMNKSDEDQFWTLDGYASWKVSDDGLTMDVTNLNQRQFGFYYCVVQSAGGDTIVVKKAINYRGPYFGNLWPKYRMNVIIGLTAAAVFFVFIVVCCVVAAYCERTPEENAKEEPRQDIRRTKRSSPEISSSGENYGLKRRDVTSTPGYDVDIMCEEVRL